MSTILEHPDAQALLDQTDVSAGTVRACSGHLTAFVQRYLPFFYRDEQRQHAQTVLKGKLTGLQRKTTEPIANQAHQKRRPLQHFVGAGKWDDPAVRAELRGHVRDELADPRAVLVVDNHGVPHGWVTGDDEFGRASDFRAELRHDHERYVLDVPCNTSVPDLSARRPPSRPGGRERLPPFERADGWAARQPKGRWRRLVLP